MKNKQLQMKWTTKAVLMTLLLSMAGMINGNAYNVTLVEDPDQIANVVLEKTTAEAGETVVILIESIKSGYCMESFHVTNQTTNELVPVYYTFDTWSYEPAGSIDDILNNDMSLPHSPSNPTPFYNAYFIFTMPDSDVTINHTYSNYYPYVYYTMVTNVSEIVPGKHYIIVGGGNTGMICHMAGQGENNRISGQSFSYNTNFPPEIRPWNIGEYEFLFPQYEFVLSGSPSEKWTIYDEKEESRGYLCAASCEENQLKTCEELTDNALWDINIATNGEATIVAQGNNTHNVIRCSGSEYSYESFSCYSSSNEQYPVYIFKKMRQDENYDFYSNSTIDMIYLGGTESYNGTGDNPYQKCTVHSPSTLTVTESIVNNTQGYQVGYWDEVNQSWQEGVYHSEFENLVIKDGAQLVANNGVNGTFEKSISAHGETVEDGGWYFIASPLSGDEYPENVENMIYTHEFSSNFDLYRFNQEAEREWENYKSHNNIMEGELFYLVNGQGYLYANENDVTLKFMNEIASSNEDVDVDLAFTENAQFAGWNLVGNPFPCNAYVNRSYYKMNETGSGIEAFETSRDEAIEPCAGILVQATAGEVANETNKVTFSRTTQGETSVNQGSLQIAVAQNSTRGNAIQDKAIVSFNEGNELGKFILNENNAMLYIPQSGKDYAIAHAEKTGEKPLCFLANDNGSYTLTISPKNVEMDYLHLVDMLTGIDVDLLQSHEYTFNATPNDYASRFRLVFSAKSAIEDESNDAPFAFISNESIIVTNAEADDLLQVVDMTGRVIVSTDVAHNVSTKGLSMGVFVLRLINGDKVRTQKIVVK